METRYSPRTGDLIAQYELVGQLKEGGMGQVWAAKRIRTENEPKGREGWSVPYGKFVAIKFLLDHHADVKTHRDNFEREVMLATLMDHGCVVHAFEWGEHKGAFYLVMQLVRGVDIRKLRQSRKLEAFSSDALVQLTTYIISHVLDGVGYVHNLRDFDGRDLNIVHRDLGPSNVMVTKTGEIQIVDFGVAQAAGFEESDYGIKGKIRYMNPEQVYAASSASCSYKVDLYGVGAMLYELLAQRVFREEYDTTPKLLYAAQHNVYPVLPDWVVQDFPQLKTIYEGLMNGTYGAAEYALGDLTNIVFRYTVKDTLAKIVENIVGSSRWDTGYLPTSVRRMPSMPSFALEPAAGTVGEHKASAPSLQPTEVLHPTPEPPKPEPPKPEPPKPEPPKLDPSLDLGPIVRPLTPPHNPPKNVDLERSTIVPQHNTPHEPPVASTPAVDEEQTTVHQHNTPHEGQAIAEPDTRLDDEVTNLLDPATVAPEALDEPTELLPGAEDCSEPPHEGPRRLEPDRLEPDSTPDAPNKPEGVLVRRIPALTVPTPATPSDAPNKPEGVPVRRIPALTVPTPAADVPAAPAQPQPFPPSSASSSATLRQPLPGDETDAWSAPASVSRPDHTLEWGRRAPTPATQEAAALASHRQFVWRFTLLVSICFCVGGGIVWVAFSYTKGTATVQEHDQ